MRTPYERHDPGATERVPEPRNPNWTPQETLLALDAYLRLRPRVPRPDHHVIIDLSRLLRLYGRLRGLEPTQTFRNEYGVSRKVFKFRAAEQGMAPNTVGGAELETVVWAQYDGDIDTVMRDADALRLEIYKWAADHQPDHEEGLTRDKRPIGFSPSQGPTPSFGSYLLSAEDKDCVVYVNLLEGDVATLFTTVPPGERVLKVGRSNAPHRRLRELNAGFPPAMSCRWTLLTVKPFGDAQSAHDAEQALLQRLAKQGRSLGGEFMRATPEAARSWFDGD